MSSEMREAPTSMVYDSLPSDTRCDYRASMEHLPKAFQPFLTWVTGKPFVGQIAKPKRTFVYLFKVLMLLGVGVSTSLVALNLHVIGVLLLICSWVATVSAARQLQVVVVHHCAHKNFSGNRRIDKWIGRIVSAGMLFRNFDTYEQSHIHHHRNPLELNDETVEFLKHLAGIEPGKSRTELWRRLWTSLISPQFHAQFLFARLVSNLGFSSLSQGILCWSLLVSVLTFIGINEAWQSFLIAWVFPLTILYQASTLLRLCSEHLWIPLAVGTKRNKDYYSQVTIGIFLGEPIPNSNQLRWKKFQQWFLWWSKLVFFYLPVRIFVLVGDTSCHDYHHRHPGTDDWANAVFARQQDIDTGCPSWAKPYQEVFGLFTAIDLAFKFLSQHPPIESTSYRSVRGVYTTLGD